MAFFSSLRSFRGNAIRLINSQWKRQFQSSIKLKSIADGGAGTHKPTPFQEKILIWTKTYKSIDEIPQRITKGQMKTAMDKFRVQVSIGMVGATFVFAAVFAMIGRKERMEGKTLTKMSTLSKRNRDSDN